MPAKRERLLLIILGAAGLISIAGISIDAGYERLRSAEDRTRRCQTQILRLEQSMRSEEELISQRNRLVGVLAEERKKYYPRNEMNPFAFGALVRKKLAAHGIVVQRYQVIEQKKMSCLEFSLTAPVESLIFFLREVSDSERYWIVSSFSLTMREGAPAADALLRIGYEVLDF